MQILDSNTHRYYFRGDPQVVPRLQALRPADLGVPPIVNSVFCVAIRFFKEKRSWKASIFRTIPNRIDFVNYIDILCSACIYTHGNHYAVRYTDVSQIGH
jgi:hypothetical protein